MVADSGIWVSEVVAGLHTWEIFAGRFASEGEASAINYLTKTRHAQVYASRGKEHWEVQVVGQGDDDAAMVDWLSCMTIGDSLIDALAVAAGLLEGIAQGQIDYALGLDPVYVGVPCA